jgi:SNF2 family DNA or RNA helicase
MVIVDEAHRLKNPKSEVTKAMHRFDTRYRYGLTGTAVQNRLSEFWCILNWCAPGKVGTNKQWCVSSFSLHLDGADVVRYRDDLISVPIKYAQKVDATNDELVLGRTRAQALVTSLLPHFWLRRFVSSSSSPLSFLLLTSPPLAAPRTTRKSSFNSRRRRTTSFSAR